jgi:hypothetical protein
MVTLNSYYSTKNGVVKIISIHTQIPWGIHAINIETNTIVAYDIEESYMNTKYGVMYSYDEEENDKNIPLEEITTSKNPEYFL